MFHPKIEYQTPENIKIFQEQEMRKMLTYIQQNSPFYRRLFREHNINPSQIQTLEDLQQIPFTSKEDLQQYNEDFYCVDKSKFVDYITTSGTLADPTTFAMTDHDLDRLAYNEAISFTCAGGYPGEYIN
jgi:phenylacetate-CoA ligase